jgi:D-alanyl-D-alanine carboxypeptidase
MSPSKHTRRAPLVLLPLAAVAILLIASPRGEGAQPGRSAASGSPRAGRLVPGPESGEPWPNLRGVARRPDAVDVLVNKAVRLPAGFTPRNLAVPGVPFIFSGFDEKRQLSRIAVQPLERLFSAAARAGVPLAGVSGYRSEATQRSLFEGYVAEMGPAAAARVSARPGRSEHQTGLAIDVTGADGACPASSCFAGTPEARWLAAHAPGYGFVIRYPAGGEASTGYSYEPWHLRYLGRPLAEEVAASHLTYEEFLAMRLG